MSANFDMRDEAGALVEAIAVAARRAFADVLRAFPTETFYYFALVTTGDGLRPAPAASSVEGLQRVMSSYGLAYPEQAAELRWSEADSPHNLYGDEHFSDVERLFLARGDHRALTAGAYRSEVELRFHAMETALRKLDETGFFGIGRERHRVTINLVAPGDEPEQIILARAARLNPEESLVQMRQDLQPLRPAN